MSTIVKMHGKMLAFSRLSITGSDIDEIVAALSDYRQKHTVPVLIDSTQMLDLALLQARLWALNIAIIGVVDGVLSTQASNLKLAIFPNDGKRIARLDDKPDNQDRPDQPATADNTQNTPSDPNAQAPNIQEPNVQEPSVQSARPKTTHQSPLETSSNPTHQSSDLVCYQMIRSGQSVHHMGGDLIITTSVNHGAEVATDYSLHIYGKGQGRLVAGATGDENARIFCQRFDPSLVSVAGAYCLKDDIPSQMIDQAVEVRFSPEQGLIFTRMNDQVTHTK